MSGYFKLQREIFDSDIWHDVSTLRLFLYLIGKASHEDNFKYKGMILNKGQWVRSYRKLADDLSYKEGRGYKKYSLSTIKHCVNKLIECERVNVNETELGTLFTVINYDRYQQNDELKKKVRTPKVSKSELSPNEVRTNAEQDQALEHYNNKDISIYRQFKHLSLSHEEFERLQNDGYTKQQIDDILDSIENYAKNKNYTNLNTTARNWLKREMKTQKPAPKQTFNRTSHKPIIPIATSEQSSVSDEEYQEMLQMAKKLEGIG